MLDRIVDCIRRPFLHYWLVVEYLKPNGDRSRLENHYFVTNSGMMKFVAKNLLKRLKYLGNACGKAYYSADCQIKTSERTQQEGSADTEE